MVFAGGLSKWFIREPELVVGCIVTPVLDTTYKSKRIHTNVGSNGADVT
jgi:hypothetical protein